MVTMIPHMSWNRITALGENRSHVYSPRNTTCMEYLKSQITFVSYLFLLLLLIFLSFGK